MIAWKQFYFLINQAHQASITFEDNSDPSPVSIIKQFYFLINAPIPPPHPTHHLYLAISNMFGLPNIIQGLEWYTDNAKIIYSTCNLTCMLYKLVTIFTRLPIKLYHRGLPEYYLREIACWILSTSQDTQEPKSKEPWGFFFYCLQY